MKNLDNDMFYVIADVFDFLGQKCVKFYNRHIYTGKNVVKAYEKLSKEDKDSYGIYVLNGLKKVEE